MAFIPEKYIARASELYERGLDLDNTIGFHATSVNRFAQILIDGKVEGHAGPCMIPFYVYLPGLKKYCPERLEELRYKPNSSRYTSIKKVIRYYAESATYEDFLNDHELSERFGWKLDEEKKYSGGVLFSFNNRILKFSIGLSSPDDAKIATSELNISFINGFEFYKGSTFVDLESAINFNLMERERQANKGKII